MLLLLQSTPPRSIYYTANMFDTAFRNVEYEDDEEDVLFLLWYEFINYHG